MRILCLMGRSNYGSPKRGEGYEFSTFLPALRSLGHDVSFFDVWDHSLYRDYGALNTALLENVLRTSPDVVFSVLSRYEVWLETLDAIRESGAITMNWAADDSWRYESFSRYLVVHLDLMVTTYRSALAKYARDGHENVILSQWAARPGQPPLSSDQCQIDVSFVGSAHGKRTAIVEKLRQAGLNVVCFGSGWTKGPVSGQQLEWVIRNSRISLNFANTPRFSGGSELAREAQLKARTFEVPGYGGFLLTQSASDLDRYFRIGGEVATFDTLDELVTKARFYLREPRERDHIAQAGYMRALSEHTYERRMADVLRALPNISGRRHSQKVFSVDLSAYQTALKHHKTAGWHRVIARLVSGLAKVMLGPERADRAPERLLYELSWRLSGSSTYRAAGWPGRLYYYS